MKPGLVDLLACPACSAPLFLEPDAEMRGGEVERGELCCASGHRFAIVRGVPRLIVESETAESQRETAASFTHKWRRASGYGFDDATRRFHLDWFLERHGFSSEEALGAWLSPRARVLDAGCGLGRDVEMFSRHCPGDVIGIDLSDVVDLAHDRLGARPNVHFVQADLTRLPFRRGAFDLLSCDQVLHHTPDTAASFRALAPFVAAGGELAIYVYRRKGPIREFADDFLRARTTNLEPEACYRFAEAVTRLGKTLSDLHATVELPEDIPFLDIKAGRYDVQRLIYWHVLKCFWNDAYDFDTNVIVNFDWYHPRDAHRHTPAEVQGWFADAGLEITRLHVIESGITARGRATCAVSRAS